MKNNIQWFNAIQAKVQLFHCTSIVLSMQLLAVYWVRAEFASAAKNEFLAIESLDLTLFYMGFWRYVNTNGGSKRPPWLKTKKNDSSLVKRNILAKIDYYCPLFMHKNWCIFTRIEGSPLWIVCGKNCRCKIFWKGPF